MTATSEEMNCVASRAAKDPTVAASQLPSLRLCAAFSGIGGHAKVVAEDFEVEEVPAYLPSGEGEHLFLWLQKRDQSGPAMVTALCEALAIPAEQVGVAGMKDARAVTRQWVSVPARVAPLLASESCQKALGAANVEVLQHRLHGNKLRTGHLRGNRFVLRLRGVDVAAAAAGLSAMVALLRRRGMPNYYGAQRFGAYGRNVAQGLYWLRGRNAPPKRGVQKRFLVSAVQSALFNVYLRQRMQAKTLHTVLEGDVLEVVRSGGPFWCDNVAADQLRLDNHEVVPTGPMFGSKMRVPRGAAALLEAELLQNAELTPAALARAGKLAQGTRRPLIVYPEELEASCDAEARMVSVRFVLPPGSYATVLLAELCGHDPCHAQQSAQGAHDSVAPGTEAGA